MKNCLYFGQELPPGHRCPPDCPAADRCLNALFEPETCALCDQPARALDLTHGPLCFEHYEALNTPDPVELQEVVR